MTTQELKQYIDKVLGNSIRCLLPSYWWKRLFNQVADRIDDVEQSTSKLIDSKVEEVKMPIVESVDELEKLELAKGRVAAVEKTGESATVKISDCYLSTNSEEDWGKYTIVKGVEEKDNVIIDKDTSVFFTASKGMVTKDAIQVNTISSGIFYYTKWTDDEAYVTSLEEVNKALSSGKYRAVQRLNAPDDYFTFYSEKPQPSLYIKGDSWEKLSKEYVVSSEEELNALSVENGTVAKVAREEEKFVGVGTLLQYEDGIDYNSLFTVKKVSISVPKTSIGELSLVYLSTKEKNITLTIVCSADGKDGYIQAWYEDGRKVDLMREQTLVQSNIDDLNSYLSKNVVRYISAGASSGSHFEFIDTWFKVATPYTVADAYIKGDTWTRLLKEGDVTGGGEMLTVYAPVSGVLDYGGTDNVMFDSAFVAIIKEAFATTKPELVTFVETFAEKAFSNNAKVYQQLLEKAETDESVILTIDFSEFLTGWYSASGLWNGVTGKAISSIPASVFFLNMSDGVKSCLITPHRICFDTNDIAFSNETLQLFEDGSIRYDKCEAGGESCSCIEEVIFYAADNTRGYTLTEDEKAKNVEAFNKQWKAYQNKTPLNRVVCVRGDVTLYMPVAYFLPSDISTLNVLKGAKLEEFYVYVNSDGSATYSESKGIDDTLSTSSTKPVQNKVITAALNNKVDKVNGKQLSTEDFTSVLKTKLESLRNYDDTSIQNAVNSLTTQINTLVSGDASVAIESFNEIIAFLNGVEDSESLDSIIAAIEQQIAAKQDKISDLETIRSGAALGATALQEHQDISHLATKEEFNAAIEGVNNGISAKQDVLVSGTNIKTFNNESILGSGNIEVNVDTSALATKEELESLTNEVITNEEVSAAAFNEINDRINAISENVSGTTVTKEEFESTVETINQTISDNKSATDTAIEGLETSIGNVDAKFANYATTESLNGAVETINNTIVENEEITAAAINDFNTRLAALESVIANL